MKAAEKVNPQHLDRILEFIKIFADKCHHAKEQELLFPAMEKAGIRREQGPIGVMFAEHNKAREHFKTFSEATTQFKSGNSKAAAKIVENAKAYIRILFAHIDKEDEVLYPMADSRLSEKEQEELAKEFELIETERIGPGKHEQFHKVLEDLKKIYLS